MTRVTPKQDAWDLKRAAQFLGVSPRTLERWVAKRLVGGLIVYTEPARGAGEKTIIAFDPDELAAWREKHMVGGRRKRAA